MVIAIALACAVLLIGQAADSPRSPAALKTYESLRRKAGPEPAMQVKLALWCEAHGLSSERLKHLSITILADPSNAAARGLLGLVEFDGHWKTTEQIRDLIKADNALSAKLAEYARRRAKLTSDQSRGLRSHDPQQPDGRNEAVNPARMTSRRRMAQAHVELALWCDRNDLKHEAIAHYMTAIHFDPDRESIWKLLGYVKRGGRWTSPDQAAVEDREERAQKQADRYWEPTLKKWKGWLVEKSRRAEAENLFAAVTDRHVLPSLLRVFPANGSQTGQTRLVRLLGQIDDPLSSRVLAAQAIGTQFDSVRLEAVNFLKCRPPRDYAGLLVEMIRGAVRYDVRPVSGPNSQGALAINAPRFRMLRTYDVPPAFELHSSFRGYVGYDANGLPIVVSGRELDSMRAFAANQEVVAVKLREVELRTASLLAMATETARLQMAADIDAIEANNQQVRDENARIMPILKMAAGAPPRLGDDEDAWHVWWYDTLGYSYQAAPKPTVAQNATPQYFAPYIRTCFAAGTPVQALDGVRPIEEIQVGDRVLSQDVASGALSFQPVVFLHHNPPDKTLRIRFSSGDSVVCSVYHRFWLANRGWAQARELKPGDILRQFDGIVRVDGVSPDSVQPLYNLDVASSRTFFVGQSKLLVHDNTLPDHRLVPFDALPGQVGQ